MAEEDIDVGMEDLQVEDTEREEQDSVTGGWFLATEAL
jgi:hypothetical protein